MAAGESALRQVLRDVLDRWDRADKLAWEARVKAKGDVPDGEPFGVLQAAEVECRALSAELADLFLVLLRCVTDGKETGERLCNQLVRLLATDIVEIVKMALTKGKGHAGS